MMPRRPPPPARQRGAATLVVVMVLFLVMALLAAYANRSLLFEQRMSSNFFRASQSAEAAEAGIEWTLAQLNGPAVDNACKPVNEGGQRFADRYLVINSVDRTVLAASRDSFGIIDCARDAAGDGWICRCPASSAAHSVRPGVAGGEQSPSFNVLLEDGKRGGTLNLTVTGCTTSTVDDCVRGNIADNSQQQVSLSVVKTMFGLVSAVRTPPATPLV
ncbi:MAG: hypothetical protein EOO80_05055, partial [Oxalobacteraceae bacterium]